MFKKDLRVKYSKLREGISQPSILNSSLSITKRVLQLPIWSYDYYHIFLSIPGKNEIDTSFLLSILKGKKKHIVVPKVLGKGTLQNCLLSKETKLIKSKWGIPEPLECSEVPSKVIDVAFVPLLAFDTHGNRVGYGKGFYDRFLGGCRNDVIKIGLSLFDAVEKIDDMGTEDVPLDYCVTDQKTYRFPSS